MPLSCLEPSGRRNLVSRATTAAARASLARAHLAACRLCAHDCGVDRLAGQAGRCHAAANARFFSAQVEVSDELEFIPTFAVALSGCDLRCAFCITGKESWNARAGAGFDAGAVARQAEQALRDGARSVMVLGGEPTIHLPDALEFVSLLPDSARLIWKTNAHAAAPARELLDGLFDVYLADFKFGDDLCAQRLAKVDNYVRIVRENLRWAGGQRSVLVVRHLLMPGHVECCWLPVARWLAENLSGTKVNLRTGFWPAWQARRHADLRSPPSLHEADRARQIAREFGLNLIQ